MRFYRLEKPNKFKEWAYNIFKAVIIALIAVVLIMLCCGYQFMIVSSGSMEPTLPVGSLVIVTPCDVEDLELGDIVTMNAGGVNLTHRIVGRYDTNNTQSRGYLLPGDAGYEESSYWVTKGDNSDTIDGALTREIVGKVQEGHAFVWIGNVVRYVRYNYVSVIVLVILVIACVWILDWLKDKLVVDDIECYENEEDEE